MHSPRQIVTPISNARNSSPQSHRPSIRPVAITSCEDDDDEHPPSPRCRIDATPDRPLSSSSSSSSEIEEIEKLKKKARGVLPGSFFTVRVTQPSSRLAIPRHNTSNDTDRRGVAKTKVSHTAPKPPRNEYIVSSEEDEEEPPHEKKKNFVDLTREEKIQDDVEGWDIEEDLIDRMMNWGGRSSTFRTKNNSSSRRSNPDSTS